MRMFRLFIYIYLLPQCTSCKSKQTNKHPNNPTHKIVAAFWTFSAFSDVFRLGHHTSIVASHSAVYDWWPVCCQPASNNNILHRGNYQYSADYVGCEVGYASWPLWLSVTMRQAWADDMSKNSQNIIQKYQNVVISWPYLESPWNMHSNKYKHAWFGLINSWNRW